MSSNFTIQPYDPLDEALQNFVAFNDDPQTSDHSEDELIQLAVHKVRNHQE